MRNKYVHRSKISEAKFRQLVKCFSLDMEALKIAQLTGLNRNTVNRYLRLLRERLLQQCAQASPFRGSVEMDESYFGGKRIPGQRGRGAFKKVPVFGLLKRNGKVYTQVVRNVSRAALHAVIQGRVTFDSVLYSDGWRAYNGLVDLGYKKHYRVNHNDNEFAQGHSHINGIESFWAFAKLRLAKFKGLSRRTFQLHLKETEYRFNHRHQNLHRNILNMCLRYPLF